MKNNSDYYKFFNTDIDTVNEKYLEGKLDETFNKKIGIDLLKELLLID
jgi:hypothetical protein